MLRNPIIASSGTYGYGLEYQRYGDPSLLGAVVAKSLTVEPRTGFPPPRVSLLPDAGSMRNALGVPNPGVKRWAETILPDMCAAKVAVVASVWGVGPEELVAAAELLAQYQGPIAWEINLSCPNSGFSRPPVSDDPETSADVCRAIRQLAPTSVGLWAKLSPDAADVIDVGLACHEAGADVLTVSNTYPSHRLYSGTLEALPGGFGGVSGSILRLQVLPLIEKFRSTAPQIDIIACGGVINSDIAIEYLDMGVKAVQVGTASLYDPRACHKVALGVVRKMSLRNR